jgi:GT2 family glycosyltransferase
VSVVTIVHDRPAPLNNLTRFLSRCRPLPGELVVVDMGSRRDPGPAVQAALDPRMRLVTVGLDRVTIDAARDGGRGLPLAAARNRGAGSAGGDLLVFLDVDCLPGPDLVDAYRSASGAAVACGPVRYLRRGWEFGAADPPGHGACLHGAPVPDFSLRDLEAASEHHPSRPAPDRTVIDQRHELFWSLSFGLHRAMWDRLGGFDETFVGYGGEDTDLAFTARRRGVPVQWLATGTVFHQWHPKSDPPVEHVAAIAANARHFRTKWGVWPMAGWLAAFAELGLLDWDPDGDRLERTGAP